MKKLFISCFCIASAILPCIGEVMYTSKICGEQTVTVDEDAFEDPAEAEAYFNELDIILCTHR